MVLGKEKYGTILRNVKGFSVTLPMYCFITQITHTISGIYGTFFVVVVRVKMLVH